MQYIGIDMSKDTFHVAFDSDLVLIFKNSKEDIARFIKKMKSLGLAKGETMLGVEATGVYHLLLSEILRSSGWKIKIINPLLTHKMISSTLRRVKTDHHDALAIRKTLMAGAGYAYTDTPDILELKTLVQEREALVKVRADMKRRIHAHSFKAKAAGVVLKDNFKGVMKALTVQIKDIEKDMLTSLPEIQKLLQSIPGIGTTTSATLVACVGDIKRFSCPEKLVAYIGLDPRVHQSGTSVHGKGYISKRGSSSLRHTLFNAAFIARQKNPDLKAYFEKKVKEGKHYFSALCAVERKLVHLIWAVWTRGTPFVKR